MRFVLLVLACALMGGGAVAIVAGAPVIMLERGAVLVGSGTVAMSAGAVVAALAAILGQLARLSRPSDPAPAEPPKVQPASSPADVPPALPHPSVAPPLPEDGEAHAVATVEMLPPETPSLAVDEAVQVVGSYASRNGSYLLYSDGSIEAKTSAGLHRFASLNELKAFVDEAET